MSYQVLALKWRPKTFAQVKGQAAVLNSLQNNLNAGILHNCYLFTGTRGVGKTTLARILAKSMNCELGLSSQPCLQCQNCISIDEGYNPDVIEVDAASKTKVDDTRELLDNLTYAPIQSRFKIYIIDEVHMLSTHSFNALLKTIEEPPKHVKFILATTDPQKIPITILSRSIQYHLQELSCLTITEQLADILTKEDISFTHEALAYIANLAHGSMRDALTCCEQVINYPERTLTLAHCETMFGIAIEDKALKLIELVVYQDKVAALDYTSNLLKENFDLLYALKTMQSIIFSISLVQVEKNAQITWPKAQILALAQYASARDLQVCYQAVVNGARDLAFVPDQKIGFQMIILRMLSFQAPKAPRAHPENPQTHINHSQPENLKPLNPTARESVPLTSANVENIIPATPIVNSTSEQVQTPAATEAKPLTVNNSMPSLATISWDQVVTQLNLKGLAKVIAENCVLDSIHENTFNMHLDDNYKPLLNDKIINSIAQGLSLHYNKNIEVNIHIQQLTVDSPAMRKKQLHDEAQNTLKQGLINNANVIALQQVFNAKLESIQLAEKS